MTGKEIQDTDHPSHGRGSLRHQAGLIVTARIHSSRGPQAPASRYIILYLEELSQLLTDFPSSWKKHQGFSGPLNLTIERK
jgi:hypothetical protein